MITRPVLRYPGGKYKMAKWIISHFPAHDFYIEPYCGASSVLMRKPRVRGEIINDLNGDVVNVFRVLREPIERARRTILRSFASIGSDGVSRRNSGFRGLKNNETNVTAAQEWSRYPNAIQSFVTRLQNVLIEQRPALHVLKLYDRKESLFYVDPPYLMSTRSKSSVLYADEMTEEDHIELANALHNVKGTVVLSGYNSELYDDLYSDWNKRMKSATAQNGKARVECLWLSPNIRTTLF
jgi:DNA adenine methylase